MTTMLLISILLLLGVWLVVRSRPRTATKDNSQEKRKSPYSAVSVRGPATACDASKRVGDQRHLASASPTLPLADCDRKASCECYFAVYDDRRRTHDRRSPYSVNTNSSGSGVFKEERRQGADRRSSSA